MKYWLSCNRNQFLGRERNFQRMLEKEREKLTVIKGFLGKYQGPLVKFDCLRTGLFKTELYFRKG